MVGWLGSAWGFEGMLLWSLCTCANFGSSQRLLGLSFLAPLMALAAIDWRDLKQKAEGFGTRNPTVSAASLTRGRRLVEPGAKEAFALTTLPAHKEASAVGAKPCCRCGLWTSCWCEACPPGVAPVGLCSECDREGLTCQLCYAAERTWEAARAARQQTEGEDEVMEISGFHNEAGDFIRLSPPLRLRTDAIARGADGQFDLDAIHQHILAAARERSDA